jgi:hypothetical protein
MITEPKDVGDVLAQAKIWEGYTLEEYVQKQVLDYRARGTATSDIDKMQVFVPNWVLELYSLLDLPLEVAGFEFVLNTLNGVDGAKVLLR